MTIEEHNRRLLEYLDRLATRHESQECGEDCTFCLQENILLETESTTGAVVRRLMGEKENG